MYFAFPSLEYTEDLVLSVLYAQDLVLDGLAAGPKYCAKPGD